MFLKLKDLADLGRNLPLGLKGLSSSTLFVSDLLLDEDVDFQDFGLASTGDIILESVECDFSIDGYFEGFAGCDFVECLEEPSDLEDFGLALRGVEE